MEFLSLAAGVGASTAILGALISILSRFAERRLDKEVERVRSSIPAEAAPAEKEQRLRSEIAGHSLAQAKATFVISLGAAVIGFVFILVGLAAVGYTLLAGPLAHGTEPAGLASQSGGLGAITTLSGIVTEAVAALFFAQTNKTREVMLETFDRLREDRKLDEALWFLKAEDSTLSKESRQRVGAFVTLYFAGLKPKDGQAQGLLAGLTEVIETKEDPNGSRQSQAPVRRRRQRSTSAVAADVVSNPGVENPP